MRGQGGSARNGIVIAAALIALGAGLAWAVYDRFRIAADLKSVKADAAAALAAVIEPAMLAALEDSVYFVSTPEGTATAFVIDREAGLLATAAHVAEDLDLVDDEPTTVVNRRSKSPIRVIAGRVHEGYETLGRLARAHQPIDPAAPSDFPATDYKAVIPIYDAAFDVGLLIVAAGDADRLGPSVPIASNEKLLGLNTGDPIAVVSYPISVVWTNVGEEEVASRAERGTIAAVQAPIDMADANEDPRYRTLIAHRMTTQAQSSGAPLIDRDGEVVGVHVIGNGPDGAAVRADAVRDLITLAGEEKSATAHLQEWRRRLARWPSAKDAIPYGLYRSMSDDDVGSGEATIGDADFSGDIPYSIDVENRWFAESAAIIPAPDLAVAGRVETIEDEDAPTPAAVKSGPHFVLPKHASYAIWRQTVEPNRVNVAFAFDYVVDEEAGYCGIGMYYRRLGDKTFKDTGPRMIPYVKLERPGEYEFAAYRLLGDDEDACGKYDFDFLAGVVSWTDERAQSVARWGDGDLLAAVNPTHFVAAAAEAKSAAVNFIDCHVWQSDRCIEPVHAHFAPDER